MTPRFLWEGTGTIRVLWGGSVELLEKCGRYFRIFRRDNELSQEKQKLLTELVGSIEADKGR